MRIPAAWRRRLIPFAFWSIPALFLSVAIAHSSNRSILKAFAIEGLPFFFWALVTPGIIDLAGRYPPESLKTVRGFLSHLGVALACGLVCGIIVSLVMVGADEAANASIKTYIIRNLIFWCFFGLLFYSIIASVGFALHSQKRNAELSRQLVEAQLGALRMQLHPHFLFNALNTVAMQVREGDRDTSVRIITRLSELLRHLLDDTAGQEIPLKTEMVQIDRYLEIERARFSDRLRVEIDIPAELETVLVPNFVLQPLVENAIRHGISARSAAHRLDIRATRKGDEVIIEIVNDGPALRPDFRISEARGVGLRNTVLRLQHLYGERGRLRIHNRDSVVVAAVHVPYRTANGR